MTQRLLDVFQRVISDNTNAVIIDNLLQRETFDDDCREVHRRCLSLGLDFLLCWSCIKADGAYDETMRIYASVLRSVPLPHMYYAEEEVTSPRREWDASSGTNDA